MSIRSESSELVRNVVSEGRAWIVCERPVPYAAQHRALVFMSDRVARRVRNYPSNWYELPAEALVEISNRA